MHNDNKYDTSSYKIVGSCASRNNNARMTHTYPQKKGSCNLDLDATSERNICRKNRKVLRHSSHFINIFILSIKPSYRIGSGPNASVSLDVNRPAPRPLARLLWCYIYARVWITCVYPYYLPEVKNRGSFGAHATVIDATCSLVRSAFERNAVGRLGCDECTENATGIDTNPSISSRQRVKTPITLVLGIQ